MHRRLFIALPIASGMQTLAAQTSAFPARALKIIVPYMPGASPDVVARFLAEKLHPILGHPVVVENRSGASGMIGAETAARSPADGHTLFISVTGIMAMNPHIFRNTIKYDALRDFKGVSLILDVPFVLTGAPGKPHTQSLAALIAAARQAPGAQRHLRAALFAGDVERGQPQALQGIGGLQQQGGFADAGVAPDQHHRPGDHAAAQHPVQFGNAARRIGQRLRLDA